MKLSTILLIDNDMLLIDLLMGEMEKHYNILQAANAEDAIGLMYSKTVDLVIMDSMIPVIGGFTLCSMIKTNIKFEHIPVIILTAGTDTEEKIAGLNHGADVCIEKPFSVAYLTGQVFNLLQNRSKLKEYFRRTSPVNLNAVTLAPADQKLMEDFYYLINLHMSNRLLDIDFLAQKLHMSRSSLYRRLKTFSDLAPYEMINDIRLRKAAYLISAGTYKMNEIAGMVGYSSPSQFAKNFKRKFNKSSSEYYKEITGIGDWDENAILSHHYKESIK